MLKLRLTSKADADLRARDLAGPREWPPFMLDLATQVQAHEPLVQCGNTWAPRAEIDALECHLTGGTGHDLGDDAARQKAGRR